MAIDYDAYMLKQDGPEPDDDNREEVDEVEDDLYYCADPWCDGHSLPGARCVDPMQEPEEDEEVCP